MGATVSTTKSYAAGLGSVFPTRSTARTSSACPPSARPGNVKLRSHAENTALSNAHWKSAGRVAPNVKSPSRSRVTAPGRVRIDVSGGPAAGDTTSQAASRASSGSACDASSTPSPHHTASNWPFATSIVSSPPPASTLRGTGDAAAESVSSPSPSTSKTVPVDGAVRGADPGRDAAAVVRQRVGRVADTHRAGRRAGGDRDGVGDAGGGGDRELRPRGRDRGVGVRGARDDGERAQQGEGGEEEAHGGAGRSDGGSRTGGPGCPTVGMRPHPFGRPPPDRVGSRGGARGGVRGRTDGARRGRA